jgi:hypothetical protein
MLAPEDRRHVVGILTRFEPGQERGQVVEFTVWAAV